MAVGTCGRLAVSGDISDGRVAAVRLSSISPPRHFGALRSDDKSRGLAAKFALLEEWEQEWSVPRVLPAQQASTLS